MVYVKQLLVYYKSTKPILPIAVSFNPDDADPDIEFETGTGLCLDLNLAQRSQYE